MDQPGHFGPFAEAAHQGGALLQGLEPLAIPEPQASLVRLVAMALPLLQPAASIRLQARLFGKPPCVGQQLQAAGVTTIIYYPIPIHRQPAYATLGYGPGSLPVTERLCAEVLSLPIFPELSADQQDTVIRALRQLLAATAAGTRSGRAHV